jgi:hypothetical protein
VKKAGLVGFSSEGKGRAEDKQLSLIVSGELEEVLPLEDADKLEQAKPITPSGGVKLDPAMVEARHYAHVKNALKHGPVAVVILGVAHDLTGSASRFTGGCEYIRVTTRRLRHATTTWGS